MYMCINTVMMCSGVCMNGEYLIKGNVRVRLRVYYVSTRQRNTAQTQTRFVCPGHQLAQCHTWQNRRMETRK